MFLYSFKYTNLASRGRSPLHSLIHFPIDEVEFGDMGEIRLFFSSSSFAFTAAAFASLSDRSRHAFSTSTSLIHVSGAVKGSPEMHADLKAICPSTNLT